jgi:hypothetical protein
LLEDQRPFDEFMEQFDFVSPFHALELDKLFWEYSNED